MNIFLVSRTLTIIWSCYLKWFVILACEIKSTAWHLKTSHNHGALPKWHHFRNRMLRIQDRPSGSRSNCYKNRKFHLKIIQNTLKIIILQAADCEPAGSCVSQHSSNHTQAAAHRLVFSEWRPHSPLSQRVIRRAAAWSHRIPSLGSHTNNLPSWLHSSSNSPRHLGNPALLLWPAGLLKAASASVSTFVLLQTG